MNHEQISGKLDQLTGKIKEKWGKLTDNDIAMYNGKQDQFFGKLKETYGLGREEAERQIKTMNSSDRAA